MTRLLAEECRKRAAECEDIAKLEKDTDLKRQYLDLAAIWRLIGKQSEETENNMLDTKGRRRAPFVLRLTRTL